MGETEVVPEYVHPIRVSHTQASKFHLSYLERLTAANALVRCHGVCLIEERETSMQCMV